MLLKIQKYCLIFFLWLLLRRLPTAVSIFSCDSGLKIHQTNTHLWNYTEKCKKVLLILWCILFIPSRKGSTIDTHRLKPQLTREWSISML